MVAIGAYILHIQATPEGGALIRAWRSRRFLNWLICLLRVFVPLRLHMAAEQWPQVALILGGEKGPVRFTEGKVRCRWTGEVLWACMGKWELAMTRAEVVRLKLALDRVRGLKA